MVNDEESRHTVASEETPLLAETVIGETPVSLGHNGYESDDDVAPTRLSGKRAAVVAFAIVCLLFIQATNITTVSTTQSDIAADLDAFSNTPWLTSAYMISVASLTPVGGRLSQIFSLRAILSLSSLLISTGLLITATSQTFPVFIVGRVVTGLGSALIYSTQTIIVLELSSKKRRGLLIGCVYTTVTVGIAAGAIIAGAMAPRFGWRSLYYIQSPICFVLAPVLYLSIPSTGQDKDSKPESFKTRLSRIDYLGILTMTAANVLLLYSLSTPNVSYTYIAISLVLFVIFLKVEATPAITTEPIVPVSIVRSRGVLLSGISSTGIMMARWAILFYLPVYGIAVRGWSPAEGGVIMIPTNAGFALGGLLVGWLHIRKATSYYISSLVISILFMLSVLLIAVLSTPNSSVVLYAIVIFINGFTCGAFLNYTVSHVLHLTSPSTHYIVTSLISTFRSTAGSFGSAIGGGIFSRVLKRRLQEGFADGSYDDGIVPDDKQELIRKLMGSPALVWQLEGYEKQAAILAYQDALRTMFLAGVALVLLMTFAQAGTGSKPPVAEEDEVVNARGEE